MKVLFKLLWILLIAGILEACNASGRLEYALECAATNKGELEKVLEHYKDEPEKYKAACFLIENMPYHYALEGEELDSLETVLASADAYRGDAEGYCRTGLGLLYPFRIAEKTGCTEYKG